MDFAKKLLGQIVFLYFIQKKGWLGIAKGGKWGDGPRNFLRQLADGAIHEKKCLLNDVLEPLFYDTLTTDRGHEGWCKTFGCRIPFLNGGLFEPLGGYDWKKTEITLPNALFTNQTRTEAGDMGDGILDVFDRYNFTVNEAEPLEKEVAIDPEMLGKVFENLIEDNRRKGLGAFYTPRQIVQFMCQKSLVNYLDAALNHSTMPIGTVRPQPAKQPPLFVVSSEKPKAGPAQGVHHAGQLALVDRRDLEDWIRQSDQFAHYAAAIAAGTKGDHYHKPPNSIRKFAHEIDVLLRDITVCDPAIGSGAFPVGMMTEIVRARMALTPYFNDVAERTAYHFKRHVIQASVHGVEIDAGAVEIAKLRLWLSLVVDEEDVRQIKPLPNLDYKVVVGNALLGFPLKPPRIQRIEKLKADYFDETDHEKKRRLKCEIDSELSQAFANSKRSLGYEVTFDFEICFSEVFRANKGFDVVIANPPYVRADVDEKHAQLRKAILDSGRYETLWEKWDLYVPFIERGYKLLKPGGVTTMIVSDAFCHSKYAQKAQNWYLKNARILRLDFCTDLQIFEAAVHNLIYLFQKADGASQKPERHVHREKFGNVTRLPSDEQTKLTYRTFFPEHAQQVGFSVATLPIGSICYVSFGCRPNSDEKRAKGLFVAADLVSETRNKERPKRYIEAKDMVRWTYTQSRWLEWGTKRSPDLLARPTFEELYEVSEKIVAADVSGAENRAAYDSAQVYHSHTLISFAPWHSLKGVRNNSLKKSARYRGEKPPRTDLPKREELEETSRRFSVKYLLGVMNSSAARDFLRANRRSNIHLYPNDWKQLPIPDVPLEKQKPVERLVDRILAAKARALSADVSALEREIDGLVYALYGLLPEKIRLVEGRAQ